jgi:hypothetical protein
MWEENLLVFTRALKEASAGSDVSHTHMGAAWCGNLTQVGTSGSLSEWRKALHWGWMSAPPSWGSRRWI